MNAILSTPRELTVLTVIRRIYPDYSQAAGSVPFEQLDIDSFDLITLRSELEVATGESIPHGQWTGFRSFSDILDALSPQAAPAPEPAQADQGDGDRRYRINMPQMAVGGLSENWLFKEMGDLHWNKLCARLGTPSHAIADELGNRLYATFVRIRYESTAPLVTYTENEPIAISNTMSRFGKGVYFSDCAIEGSQKRIAGRLMSSFTSRQDSQSNTSLLKGEPAAPANRVDEVTSMPEFSTLYRNMRKGLLQTLLLGGREIPVSEATLYETEYEMNPYYDLNGVNLLYFAAYPVIHDICERRYVNSGAAGLSPKAEWSAVASTLARDVFYFGNMNASDSVLFRLNHFEVDGDGILASACSLYRKSDAVKVAGSFAVKRVGASPAATSIP